MKNDKKYDHLKGDAMHILKESVEALSELAKNAKNKYDEADEETKKKIKAGIMGAIGLMAAAIGVKKIMKRRKKNSNDD